MIITRISYLLDFCSTVFSIETSSKLTDYQRDFQFLSISSSNLYPFVMIDLTLVLILSRRFIILLADWRRHLAAISVIIEHMVIWWWLVIMSWWLGESKIPQERNRVWELTWFKIHYIIRTMVNILLKNLFIKRLQHISIIFTRP